MFCSDKSYTPFMVYVSKQIVLFFYYFTRVYKKFIPKDDVQTIGWYWVPLVFDFLLNVVFIISSKSFNEINLKKKHSRYHFGGILRDYLNVIGFFPNHY